MVYAANSKFNYMKTIGFQNNSECYDDFNCDLHKNADLLHRTFAGLCFFLCIAGLIFNPLCLPAFNTASNRSGATFYLTIILICDTLYVFFVMLLYVVRYMPVSYQEQMEVYATFNAYMIPSCLPFITFFELVVVWLILALLIDRLLYLKVGFQSKTMLSRALSIKVSCIFIFAIFCYTIPKFLEYKTVPMAKFGVARVVYTSIGENQYYQKLMHNWLKVPLEIFFPYLGVGVFSIMVVMKMVDLHISKWKAVVSYCDNMQCCGQSCKDVHESIEDVEENEHCCPSNDGQSYWMTAVSVSDEDPNEQQPEDKVTTDVIEADPVPFEVVSKANRPMITPSFESETRENANVVIAVTLGFLLIFFKIPKFLLHVLENEQYAVYDPNSYKATNYLLDVIYATIKPLVCLLVGAHFRGALMDLCCGCLRLTKQNSLSTKKYNAASTSKPNNKTATNHKASLLRGDCPI